MSIPALLLLLTGCLSLRFGCIRLVENGLPHTASLLAAVSGAAIAVGCVNL